MKTLDGLAAGRRGRSLRVGVTVGLAGLSLAACASVNPQVARLATPPPPIALPPAPLDLPPLPQAKKKPQPKPTRKRTAVARQGANGGRYKVGLPYRIAGVTYVPAEQPSYDQVGVASWYGDEFNGKRTANGERFDMFSASAAHTTLPMPSIVEVTNLENGRSMRVRLNDRGPFKAGRIIDLSRNAAHELGYLNKGLAKVRVRYIGPARLDGSVAPLYVAQAPLAAKASLKLAALAPQDTPRAARATWKAPARVRTRTTVAAARPSIQPVAFTVARADDASKLAPLW